MIKIAGGIILGFFGIVTLLFVIGFAAGWSEKFLERAGLKAVSLIDKTTLSRLKIRNAVNRHPKIFLGSLISLALIFGMSLGFWLL